MGLIATDSGGGNFKRVPPGAYIARCFRLIDMGTQESNGQYGLKLQHRMRVVWEVFGEDEAGEALTVDVDGHAMPLSVSKDYTISLHEKSALRKDLAAWRGRDFTADELKAFDVSKLLGAYCMVNVQHSEANNKTYTNVASLTPLPGALKNSQPAGVHENQVFDLDKPDWALYESFHDKLKETIAKSPEFQALKRVVNAPSAANAMAEIDGDIPF